VARVATRGIVNRWSLIIRGSAAQGSWRRWRRDGCATRAARVHVLLTQFVAALSRGRTRCIIVLVVTPVSREDFGDSYALFRRVRERVTSSFDQKEEVRKRDREERFLSRWRTLQDVLWLDESGVYLDGQEARERQRRADTRYAETYFAGGWDQRGSREKEQYQVCVPFVFCHNLQHRWNGATLGGRMGEEVRLLARRGCYHEFRSSSNYALLYRRYYSQRIYIRTLCVRGSRTASRICQPWNYARIDPLAIPLCVDSKPFPPLYLSVQRRKIWNLHDSDKFNIRMLRDEEELIPKVEWIIANKTRSVIIASTSRGINELSKWRLWGSVGSFWDLKQHIY